MFDVLEKVDREVRETLTYGRDNAEHGFDDWKLPDRAEEEGVGDCEDFMLLAARKLIDAGFDPSKMYFVLAHTEGGATFNHAFLAVETPVGLYLCADTMATCATELGSVYFGFELRRWARVSEPTSWRYWGDNK